MTERYSAAFPQETRDTRGLEFENRDIAEMIREEFEALERKRARMEAEKAAAPNDETRRAFEMGLTALKGRAVDLKSAIEDPDRASAFRSYQIHYARGVDAPVGVRVLQETLNEGEGVDNPPPIRRRRSGNVQEGLRRAARRSIELGAEGVRRSAPIVREAVRKSTPVVKEAIRKSAPVVKEAVRKSAPVIGAALKQGVKSGARISRMALPDRVKLWGAAQAEEFKKSRAASARRELERESRQVMQLQSEVQRLDQEIANAATPEARTQLQSERNSVQERFRQGQEREQKAREKFQNLQQEERSLREDRNRVAQEVLDRIDAKVEPIERELETSRTEWENLERELADSRRRYSTAQREHFNMEQELNRYWNVRFWQIFKVMEKVRCEKALKKAGKILEREKNTLDERETKLKALHEKMTKTEEKMEPLRRKRAKYERYLDAAPAGAPAHP